jgi:hypothetical protein
VKRARFTLLPAPEKGFQHLVEGESSIRKPPEWGDKTQGFAGEPIVFLYDLLSGCIA